MIERRALAFATAAHAGQVRKYTGEPYINHPVEVSEILRKTGGNADMVCAALLHDVVEDCGITLDDIEHDFGHNIRTLVFWLTDVSRPEDGNRATRKAIDRAHIFQAPGAAQTIKVADLISNTRTIMDRDPGFAKIYMAEKRLLLAGLIRAHPVLHAEAVGIVDTYYANSGNEDGL